MPMSGGEFAGEAQVRVQKWKKRRRMKRRRRAVGDIFVATDWREEGMPKVIGEKDGVRKSMAKNH